jgi:hypothetical protein
MFTNSRLFAEYWPKIKTHTIKSAKAGAPMLVVYTASQVLEKLGAFDAYPAIDIPFHFL